MLPRGDPSKSDEPAGYTRRETSMLPMQNMQMEEKVEVVQEQGLQKKTDLRELHREDPSMGDKKSVSSKQKPSMLPLHKTVPAMRGLWATGRRGCHWYPAKCCVFLRDMCMEEKAEAVQERSVQRNTIFRVLPRRDPSNGDEKSEYAKQKSHMLPVHQKKMAVPAVRGLWETGSKGCHW